MSLVLLPLRISDNDDALAQPDLTEFIVRRCARIVPLAYLYISLVFILFPMTLGEALSATPSS
jgi:peptidoglycan/LPS O-acetylase OafA/YrhL